MVIMSFVLVLAIAAFIIHRQAVELDVLSNKYFRARTEAGARIKAIDGLVAKCEEQAEQIEFLKGIYKNSEEARKKLYTEKQELLKRDWGEIPEGEGYDKRN